VRTKTVYAASAAALAVGFSLALGGGALSEFGAQPSYTGALAIRSKPAELDCTLCHFPTEGSNLNTTGGAIEILDLPVTYTAAQTYRLRVRLSTDSTAAYLGRNWGFQLTSVRASDGEGCGTFLLDDADSLQIVSGADGDYPELASRRYVQHTILGDREGLASPVEWTFSWRAPDTPQDTAFFFCAGNATNGSTDSFGDFIFTAADTVIDVTTPALSVSWGGVKRRYRN
jgi:hypothetical protein